MTNGPVADAPFSSQEFRAALRLFMVLDVFREFRHAAPLHLIPTLLLVATDEGKSVIHYARKCGVSQSVMSRQLLELSTSVRHGEPGFGLVEKRTASRSLREQEVYLTPAGRSVLRRALVIMTGGFLP
jgi:hypothetical protein